MKTLALVIAAAALLVAQPSLGALYKWVDEKGVVHYSDKVPPEAIDKGNVELNKDGVAVKRNEPAPTAEQRRAKAAEEERQKVLAKEREVVERRDRALQQSYTSEDEIDLARARALSTIETQLVSAQAYSVQLTKRKGELEARRKSFGDKPVPAPIEHELESIGSELGKQDAFIAEKRRETAMVTARYDADKQRWRELRAIADANREKELGNTGGSGSAAAPGGTRGHAAPMGGAAASNAR